MIDTHAERRPARPRRRRVSRPARSGRFVRSYPGPRLMSINGDEGEPGTFKDRVYLERDPHRTLEGALIAAHAVEAERIYFYMRDEYPAVLAILRTRDRRARGGRHRRARASSSCAAAPAPISAARKARCWKASRASAACRAIARPTSPRSACSAARRSTTMSRRCGGSATSSRKAPNGSRRKASRVIPASRSWSVSGRVKNPGVKLAPAGVTVRELIEDYCGGMADGHTFKAYLPGGASGGILPASMGDIPLDFGGELAKQGAFVGSHADRGLLRPGQRQGRDASTSEVLPA